MKRIYFDIDNTINDFYQNDWLECILNEDTKPYDIAPCILPESKMLDLIEKGYTLGIVSWLAKNASKDYDNRVRQAKKKWLKIHYPNIKFEEIHIVKYGTPKYKVVKYKEGILFDDEQPNRDAWKGQAYEPKEVFNF